MEYEPGTVAFATVRGVPNLRVNRWRDVFGHLKWDTVEPVQTSAGPRCSFTDEDVTDVRPLVVLDVASMRGKMTAAPSMDELPTWLRTLADANSRGGNTLGSQAARLLADQIEAQTKPPRIPEPGLGKHVFAIKPDGIRSEFVRVGSRHWSEIGNGSGWEWGDLIDPVIVRRGIDA